MAELNEEEGRQLVEAFNKLKLKPKCDTKEDLESWLIAYAKEVKPDPEVTTVKKTESTDKVITTTVPQQPRISLFYGDNIKGEVSYPQWVYEVKCLLIEKTHKPEIILQAVRRSVRGEAGNLVRRLGTGATVTQILEKFESVYGEVDTKEHLLGKFYSAKQEESEDITKWSCRLEDILSNAVDRKIVEPEKVNEMLTNMFWQGLKPSLKDISGYLVDSIKDFDKLRVEMRKLEQDHMESNGFPCKVVTEEKSNSDMKEMKTMIQSLNNTVKQLEKKFNTPTEQTSYQNSNPRQKFKPKRGYHQGGYNPNYTRPYQGPIRFNNYRFANKGRFQQHQDYPSQNQASGFNNSNFPVQSQYQGQNETQGQYQGQGQTQYGGQRHFQDQNQFQGQGQFSNQGQTPFQGQGETPDQNKFQGQGQEDSFNRGPLCYRCHQYNHYQWNCPVGRMDHSKKYLN